MARYNLDSLDVLEVLDELGIDYSESGKNIGSGWVGITECPWCGDTGNHLGVNLDHKGISCFKCGQTGSLLTYLSNVVGFRKANNTIQSMLPRELTIRLQDVYQSNVEIVKLPIMAKEGLLPPHAQYLRKRGFDPDYLSKTFHLHSVGPVGDFPNCIILPIYIRRKLVTFTSIHIGKYIEDRYIHCSKEKSIAHTKELLYMEERAKNTIYPCEGIFDAWRLGLGAVPLWGTKFTQAQVKALSKYQRIVIVGDGDNSGYKFNRKLSAELAPYAEVKYIDLPEGVDPDDLTKEEIAYIKREG